MYLSCKNMHFSDVFMYVIGPFYVSHDIGSSTGSVLHKLNFNQWSGMSIMSCQENWKHDDFGSPLITLEVVFYIICHNDASPPAITPLGIRKRRRRRRRETSYCKLNNGTGLRGILHHGSIFAHLADTEQHLQ